MGKIFEFDVSIIIVNYNTIHLLLNTIKSIIKNTDDVLYEIIVVDNNSSDDSKVKLHQLYGNKINYISLDSNIGFGRANNAALELAKGRNIFFLNPDTIILNNAVKLLSSFLDENKDVGVCGGNLYDENKHPTHSFQRFFPSIMLEINNLMFNIPLKMIYGRNPDFNFKDKPLNVAYITGADLMIKREILDLVGHFNHNFFMYYEETELCYRVKKKKFKIVSLPNAKIQHLEGKSFGESKINKTKLEMIYSSRLLFFNICYNKVYVKTANIILEINVLMRILCFFILNKPLKLKYWQTVNNVLKKND